MPRRLLYVLLILTTPIVASAASADPPSALKLGTRLELFVDEPGEPLVPPLELALEIGRGVVGGHV